MNKIKIRYKLEPGRVSEFDNFENASLDAAKLLPHIKSSGESIFAFGDGLGMTARVYLCLLNDSTDDGIQASTFDFIRKEAISLHSFSGSFDRKFMLKITFENITFGGPPVPTPTLTLSWFQFRQHYVGAFE